MRRVKVNSFEHAVFLRGVRKDFRRYIKRMKRSDDATAQQHNRTLIEVTCPVCGVLFSDTVDASSWNQSTSRVWCKNPHHRYEIDQSEGTMKRVEAISATWYAGHYYTLGMEVMWIHRSKVYYGDLSAIAFPYQEIEQLLPPKIPKSRLKMHGNNVHRHRVVITKQEGTKKMFYVVSLSSCKPSGNALLQKSVQ